MRGIIKKSEPRSRLLAPRPLVFAQNSNTFPKGRHGGNSPARGRVGRATRRRNGRSADWSGGVGRRVRGRAELRASPAALRRCDPEAGGPADGGGGGARRGPP